MRGLILGAAIILLGVLLHVPTLRAGLVADDLLQRAMLDGSFAAERAAWDLYAFSASAADRDLLVADGTLPWWSEPGLRLAAFRPLASLLVAFDHHLLGGSARLAHAHSLLWLAAILGLFRLLSARLLPAGPALLALAVFAFDGTHVIPVGWLANRTALVSAAFGLLGLWAHLRSREQGWLAGRWLAPLAFTLAFAGGEYALALIGYVVAYEAFAAAGSAARRLLHSSVVLVPAAAYALAYALLGYGATGFGYVDPLREPVRFASVAIERIPSLLEAELLHLPAEVIHHVRGVWLLAPPTLAVLLLLPGAFRRLEQPSRRLLLALSAGSLLSMLPMAGSIPNTRLLLIPSIGGSLLLGVLLWDGWLALRLRERRRSVWSWLSALVVLPLFLLHVATAPLTVFGASRDWTKAQLAFDRMHLADGATPAVERQVLLNAIDLRSIIYPPYIQRFHGKPRPKLWRALSNTPRPLQVVRTADDTLELSAEGGVLEHPVAEMFRRPRPLEAGERFRLPDMEIEILARGGTHVRYRFDRSLDDPSIALLMLQGETIRRLDRLPVGSRIRTPPL
jgi:hypothetical protein